MNLFFTNIPAQTKNEELYGFIVDSVTSWRIQDIDRQITRCEVLRITNRETSNREYHALVSFKTEELGNRVIEKLDGRQFGDRKIQVREYAHRVPGDQRFKHEDLWLTRPTDRRRQNLKIERQKRISKDTTQDWFKRKQAD